MDDSAFETVALATLQRYADLVEGASDDLEVDLEGGILTIRCEDGATFVLNRHGPLKQLWLSSPLSGASHFAYDVAGRRWTSTRGGASLDRVFADDLARAAGVAVTLE